MNENDTVWALKGTLDSDRWEEYQDVANFVSALQRDEDGTDWFDDETLTAVLWYSNDDALAVNIAVRYDEEQSHIVSSHLYLDHDVDRKDADTHLTHEGGDALSLLAELRWGFDKPDSWFSSRYIQSYLSKLDSMVQAGRTA